MASVIQRIKEYTRTPQGRRTMEQVRRTASDPRRRTQARRLLERLRTKR
ncbi:hypothetical protein [Streptomyces phaeoluteigriseus]